MPINCGGKTAKSRCKQKCTIGDFKISSMLLEDKIAFIKTTIVPNILEIEGYCQVRVPRCWKLAADNVNNNWTTKLQCGSYTSLFCYFVDLCVSFVSGSDGDELINGKIVKYAPHQSSINKIVKAGNNNQINNNNNNNNNDKRIEMEITVVPGEKDNKYKKKFCQMMLHSRVRSFVLNEKKQEKVKPHSYSHDKHEKMKNGIIEYYCSFNQLSKNYAPCLMDNSKYIGHISPWTSRYCKFEGWGEIYSKNCNDKSNEYTFICKCLFSSNTMSLSSIIDSSYRQTVRNFINIDVSSLADIKVNFLKSPCLQIGNLLKLKQNNYNNNKNNNNNNNSNDHEFHGYVLFSRLYYEREMEAFSCRNNAFTQYLIDKKIICTIDSCSDVTRSFNYKRNLLHYVCESGNNDLFEQLLSKMKHHMTLRQSQLKDQAAYEKLVRSKGKQKCVHPVQFATPENPANMLLRCSRDTGMAPLHIACINGYFDIILNIFNNIVESNQFSNGGPSKGRILDTKTRDGWNLLGLSIIYEHTKIFEYLVKNHGIYYQATNIADEIKFGDRIGSLNGFSIVELAFENESFNVLDFIFSKYISQWINFVIIKNFEKGIARNEKTLKDKQSRLFNFYHIKFNNGMSLQQKLCNLSMRQDGQKWQTGYSG